MKSLMSSIVAEAVEGWAGEETLTPMRGAALEGRRDASFGEVLRRFQQSEEEEESSAPIVPERPAIVGARHSEVAGTTEGAAARLAPELERIVAAVVVGVDRHRRRVVVVEAETARGRARVTVRRSGSGVEVRVAAPPELRALLDAHRGEFLAGCRSRGLKVVGFRTT